MRDYFKELIQLAAQDTSTATVRADEFADEIRDRVRRLHDQLGHIMDMQTYLSDMESETDTGGHRDIPRLERPIRIKEAAIALVNEGYMTLSSQMVQDHLARSGWRLSVQQPNAVIGTVLARSPEFNRTDTNEFEFVDR